MVEGIHKLAKQRIKRIMIFLVNLRLMQALWQASTRHRMARMVPRQTSVDCLNECRVTRNRWLS